MGPIEAGTCQKICPGTRSWRRLKPPSDALYMNLTTGSDSSPRRRIFQSKLVLLDFRKLQTAVLQCKRQKRRSRPGLGDGEVPCGLQNLPGCTLARAFELSLSGVGSFLAVFLA